MGHFLFDCTETFFSICILIVLTFPKNTLMKVVIWKHFGRHASDPLQGELFPVSISCLLCLWTLDFFFNFKIKSANVEGTPALSLLGVCDPCKAGRESKEYPLTFILSQCWSISLSDIACHSEWCLVHNQEAWRTELLKSGLEFHFLKLPEGLNLKCLGDKIKSK